MVVQVETGVRSYDDNYELVYAAFKLLVSTIDSWGFDTTRYAGTGYKYVSSGTIGYQ